jgi:hypothetical protein
MTEELCLQFTWDICRVLAYPEGYPTDLDAIQPICMRRDLLLEILLCLKITLGFCGRKPSMGRTSRNQNGTLKFSLGFTPTFVNPADRCPQMDSVHVVRA